jgi:thioredoxin-related protein
LQNLLGPTLYKHGVGEVGTKAVLKDKTHIGIFFGAAWSGSCKQFLDPLVKVYKKLTEDKKKKFEIVYVPATVPGRPPEDEQSFKELMEIMSWLAVPLSRKAVHRKLTRRFQVRQIPMLVLLDSEAKTIHRDITPAVTHIIEGEDGDSFAEQFPWDEKRQTNIKSMLGGVFLKGNGSEVSINELEGKYIGVLFSATWHWNCRRFQQMLEYMYEKLKNEGKAFEIIDMDFSAEIPWLALPQKAFEVKQKLGEAFRVEQCPMLVIIDPDGAVVTTEGVEIVNKDTDGDCFPWTPKPLYDLSTLEPEILGEMNDTVTCVVLCEGCSEDVKQDLTKAMMPVAQEAFDAAKASGCEAGMLFFTATETSDVVHQLRMSCELGEPTASPQMVILDIPDSGAYYVFDGDNITTETMSSFIEDYDEERLERKELQEDAEAADGEAND